MERRVLKIDRSPVKDGVRTTVVYEVEDEAGNFNLEGRIRSRTESRQLDRDLQGLVPWIKELCGWPEDLNVTVCGMDFSYGDEMKVKLKTNLLCAPQAETVALSTPNLPTGSPGFAAVLEAIHQQALNYVDIHSPQQEEIVFEEPDGGMGEFLAEPGSEEDPAPSAHGTL